MAHSSLWFIGLGTSFSRVGLGLSRENEDSPPSASSDASRQSLSPSSLSSLVLRPTGLRLCLVFIYFCITFRDLLTR